MWHSVILSHIHLLIIFANVLTPQPTEQFCLYCSSTYGEHCMCVSCLSTVCHALVFPMPLLCQPLCVICRQLEVWGNRDLLLFSHMPLSTHPSSFLLSRHLCLFVCLHVKAVALVSLTHTHSPSSYYVSQHSSFFLLSPNPRRCALGSDRVKRQTSHKSHVSQIGLSLLVWVL